MPLFAVAAGGTVVLALRLASRFLRRNDSDKHKDDYFFADEYPGATSGYSHGALSSRVASTSPIRRPEGSLGGDLSVQGTWTESASLRPGVEPQPWLLSAKNLQAATGHQERANESTRAGLAAGSVSSSEVRRRAASVLKVRDWDDAGAAQDWNHAGGSPEGSGCSSSGGSSQDERVRLVAFDSCGDEPPPGLTSVDEALAVAITRLEGPSATNATPSPIGMQPSQPSTAAPQGQNVTPVFAKEAAATAAQQPLSLGSRCQSEVEGRGGCINNEGHSLTVGSSLVGNCSRNSGTDASVPFRSCGTGTATLTSSTSPDTNSADLHEQRSDETDSESRLEKNKSLGSSDDKPGESKDMTQAAADVISETLAIGKADQASAVALAAAAAPVVVGAAAVATQAEAVLPAALRSSPEPVPEPVALPLPPTILATRAPDPRTILAIQTQVETLRLQHLQRQAQALLSAPAASRGTPLNPAVALAPVSMAGPSPPGLSSPIAAGGAASDARPCGSHMSSNMLGGISGVTSMGTTPVLGTLPAPLRPGVISPNRAPNPAPFPGAQAGLPAHGPPVLTNEALMQILQSQRMAGAQQPASLGGPGTANLVGAGWQGPVQQLPAAVPGSYSFSGASPAAVSAAAAVPNVVGMGIPQGGQTSMAMSAHSQMQPHPPQLRVASLPGTTWNSTAAPVSTSCASSLSAASRQPQWPDAAVQAARMSTLQRQPRAAAGEQPAVLSAQPYSQARIGSNPLPGDVPVQVGFQQALPAFQGPGISMVQGAPLGPNGWVAGTAAGAGAGAVGEAHVRSRGVSSVSFPSAHQAALPQALPVPRSQPTNAGPSARQLSATSSSLQQGGAGPAKAPLATAASPHAQPISQSANQHAAARQDGPGIEREALDAATATQSRGSAQHGPMRHNPSWPQPATPPRSSGHRQEGSRGESPLRFASLHDAPAEMAVPAAGASPRSNQQSSFSPPHSRQGARGPVPTSGIVPPAGQQQQQQFQTQAQQVHSPPRSNPTSSDVLLSSPPSFRHQLKAGEGGARDLESARRTQDWLNSTRLEDPVSPTLRPHPMPRPNVASAASEPFMSAQSPVRLQTSPSQRLPSPLQHQDTVRSRGARSSQTSAQGSVQVSTSGSRHQRGSGSKKKQRMQQQLLLQQKLANQPPPSPLALYSARLLHQAGEKLVPAPRMPGGGAFFVPLKHDLRLEIDSRPDSAISGSGDEVSTSHLSATTGYGEIQTSFLSANNMRPQAAGPSQFSTATAGFQI